MRAPWTGTRRARLETGCSERLGLPLVRADELGHRQHVPLDRLLQLGLSRAGGEIRLDLAVRLGPGDQVPLPGGRLALREPEGGEGRGRLAPGDLPVRTHRDD